jgi:hypothetical protein
MARIIDPASMKEPEWFPSEDDARFEISPVF